jgi:hypothetical protein
VVDKGYCASPGRCASFVMCGGERVDLREGEVGDGIVCALYCFGGRWDTDSNNRFGPAYAQFNAVWMVIFKLFDGRY